MAEYDPNNIFARIIRGELPCTKVYEDNYVLAFKDIHPQAPVHVLLCPKGPYVSMTEFSQNASAEEVQALMRAIGKIVTDLGLDKTGYRTITNAGAHGAPEVPHLHIHILGGRALGPMLNKAS